MTHGRTRRARRIRVGGTFGAPSGAATWRPRMRPGRRVLDAGSGAGYGTSLLKLAGSGFGAGRRRRSRDGAAAREHFAEPGVDSWWTTASYSTNVTGPFDLICCFEVIEHLQHPEQFLRRAGNCWPRKACCWSRRRTAPRRRRLSTAARAIRFTSTSGIGRSSSNCWPTHFAEVELRVQVESVALHSRMEAVRRAAARPDVEQSAGQSVLAQMALGAEAKPRLEKAGRTGGPHDRRLSDRSLGAGAVYGTPWFCFAICRQPNGTADRLKAHEPVEQSMTGPRWNELRRRRYQAAGDDEDFLLVTWDSCRYDVYQQARTPVLDRHATAERGWAMATYTLPAHQAMFCGFLPHVFEPAPFYNRYVQQLWRISHRNVHVKPLVTFPEGTGNIVRGFRAAAMRRSAWPRWTGLLAAKHAARRFRVVPRHRHNARLQNEMLIGPGSPPSRAPAVLCVRQLRRDAQPLSSRGNGRRQRPVGKKISLSRLFNQTGVTDDGQDGRGTVPAAGRVCRVSRRADGRADRASSPSEVARPRSWSAAIMASAWASRVCTATPSTTRR